MALIICAECGGQVSDKASACPKCGAPVEAAQLAASQLNLPSSAEDLANAQVARWARLAGEDAGELENSADARAGSSPLAP